MREDDGGYVKDDDNDGDGNHDDGDDDGFDIDDNGDISDVLVTMVIELEWLTNFGPK